MHKDIILAVKCNRRNCLYPVDECSRCEYFGGLGSHYRVITCNYDCDKEKRKNEYIHDIIEFYRNNPIDMFKW